MLYRRIFALVTALACALCLGLPALGAEVDCDATYCFSAEELSQGAALTGIFLTGVPDAATGTLMLGTRVLGAGDILTSEQASQMTFHPVQTETDREAVLTYLPILAEGVEDTAVMSIAVLGKRDQAPVAEDSTLETYKNLPNEGLLKVSDPEGQELTYTVVRQPRRGQVVIREDGSFHYTPKKNKVGVDSFTYTATDSAGNVSREATVTVTILKPQDATQYSDTAGESCRFAAEWMKNTGIFAGEVIGGNRCFRPEKQVSRGEFLTMLVGALDLPLEESSTAGYTDQAPQWLQPYLAAAMRSGLTTGCPDPEVFRADDPITGAEAAVMLQNLLDLTASEQQTLSQEESAVPAWARDSLEVMAQHGIALEADGILTRGQAAQILYQASQLADSSIILNKIA